MVTKSLSQLKLSRIQKICYCDIILNSMPALMLLDTAGHEPHMAEKGEVR